jgi:hypothetical protein
MPVPLDRTVVAISVQSELDVSFGLTCTIGAPRQFLMSSLFEGLRWLAGTYLHEFQGSHVPALFSLGSGTGLLDLGKARGARRVWVESPGAVAGWHDLCLAVLLL